VIGITQDGVAVEKGAEAAPAPALAHLTVPQLRGFVAKVLKAGGISPAGVQEVLGRSRVSLWRDERALKKKAS
jgi:hypothetical protein